MIPVVGFALSDEQMFDFYILKARYLACWSTTVEEITVFSSLFQGREGAQQLETTVQVFTSFAIGRLKGHLKV